MSNYLSIPVVCKVHKKPCEIVGPPGFKKIKRPCCSDILRLEDIECHIYNNTLHI